MFPLTKLNFVGQLEINLWSLKLANKCRILQPDISFRDHKFISSWENSSEMGDGTSDRWENSSAPSSSKPAMKASGTLALIQARSFDLSLSGPAELLSILSSTCCDITQRQLNETMVWFAYQKDARTSDSSPAESKSASMIRALVSMRQDSMRSLLSEGTARLTSRGELNIEGCFVACQGRGRGRLSRCENS